MSYALEITDEARDDLERLVDSLPAARRPEAIDGVDVALSRLAANPGLASGRHLGRPTYHFEFLSGGVSYHWAVTFQFSEDERAIQVTHMYRPLL